MKTKSIGVFACVGCLLAFALPCAAAFAAEPLNLNGGWEFAFAEGKTVETAGGPDLFLLKMVKDVM